MSLNNVNMVSGIDPINEYFMEVGQNNSLPLDVIPNIFKHINVMAELPSLALVCKNWRVLADNGSFGKMIRPPHIFGSKEWHDYIGVDAGEEPPLPRCAYSNIEKNGGLVTFIPDKVKITHENGIIEEVLLDNLEAICNLIKAPKSDLITGYASYASQEELKEKRLREKPHWVWINEIIGIENTYKQQQILAKTRGQGAHISGIIDAEITAGMKYSKINAVDILWNPELARVVRVNDRSAGTNGNGAKTTFGFGRSGLYVKKGDCDIAHHGIGVAIARKFSMPSEQARSLFSLFYEERRKINPLHRIPTGDIKYIYLRAIDKLLCYHTPEDVQKVIQWCMGQPFWIRHIQTPSQLNDSFKSIVVDMVASQPKV